jgi:acetyl esterase
MPVDPQVQVILDQLAALPDERRLVHMSVEEGRAMLERLSATAGGDAAELASVDDRAFSGPAGDVPVRIYRPAADGTDAAACEPALVWFHGGGWVLGSIETADVTCRRLARDAGVVVVSVGYRRAPDHPYPAGLDDCYAALVWVAANAAELHIDAGRIAIGGDSAGGNLAAAVALAARDRRGPAVCFQLLVYPVTDALQSYPSIRENGEGYLLTTEAMEWFVVHYLGAGHEHGNPKDPLVSPLYAEDLSGLPPALVITAEYDPLRDEGEAYGLRLQQAGVAAKVSRYDGMIHGFFGMAGLVDAAQPALDEAAAAVVAAVRRGGALT